MLAAMRGDYSGEPTKDPRLTRLSTLVNGNPGIFLFGAKVKQTGDAEVAMRSAAAGHSEAETRVAVRDYRARVEAVAGALADSKTYLSDLGRGSVEQLVASAATAANRLDPAQVGRDLAKASNLVAGALRIDPPAAQDAARNVYDDAADAALVAFVESQLLNTRRVANDPAAVRMGPEARAPAQEQSVAAAQTWCKWLVAARAAHGQSLNHSPGRHVTRQIDPNILVGCGLDASGQRLHPKSPDTPTRRSGSWLAAVKARSARHHREQHEQEQLKQKQHAERIGQVTAARHPHPAANPLDPRRPK